MNKMTNEEAIESLEFFKSELNDFELCKKHDTPSIQNDEGHYLNRLIKHHNIAINLLEERINEFCEVNREEN